MIDDLIDQFLNRSKKAGQRRHLQAPLSAGVMNCANNDYMCLRQHPALMAVWKNTDSAGSGASRLVTGNMDAHIQTERQLADFKDRPASLLFPSGYQANIAVLSALLHPDLYHGQRQPLLFFDRANHASLYMAVRGYRCPLYRYHHNDMVMLEALLQKHVHQDSQPIIVTETLFSMDGDSPDFEKLQDLANHYKALLVIDDAHALGVFGAKGQGLSAYCPQAHVVLGSFGKAAGLMGGYVACSDNMRDYFVQKAGGFIYSTAVMPGLCHSIHLALSLLTNMIGHRQHLQDLASQVLAGLREQGWQGLPPSPSPIIPLIYPDNDRLLALQQDLYQAGFYLHLFRPPTVPMGTQRLRLSLNCQMQISDIDRILQVTAKWV